MAWMQTWSGRIIDFDKPIVDQVGSIDLADIAHALVRICRYGGHVDWWSVGAHGLLVSDLCEPYCPMDGQMHDDAEAYLGDQLTAIKVHLRRLETKHPGRSGLDVMHATFDDVIGSMYGLTWMNPGQSHDVVASMDHLALRLEVGRMFPAGTPVHKELAITCEEVAAAGDGFRELVRRGDAKLLELMQIEDLGSPKGREAIERLFLDRFNDLAVK